MPSLFGEIENYHIKCITEDVQLLSHAFLQLQHSDCLPNCIFQHTRAYSIPHSYIPYNTINVISCNTTMQGSSVTIFNCHDVFRECLIVNKLSMYKNTRLNLKVFLLEYFILELYSLTWKKLFTVCVCLYAYQPVCLFVLLIVD